MSANQSTDESFESVFRPATFILTAGSLLISPLAISTAFYKERPALTAPYVTAGMLLFDSGYVLTFGALLLVYLAWRRSRTAAHPPPAAVVRVTLLVIGNLMLLNYLSQLDAGELPVNHLIMIAGLISSSCGLILWLAESTRFAAWLPIAAPVGLGLVMISATAYSGQLHLQRYYGSGLQKPLATVLAFSGLWLLITSAWKWGSQPQ